MFWLKKTIALFTYPLGLLLALLLAGLLLLWRNPQSRWARPMLGASFLGLVLVCCGPAGDLLIAPLENRHPPLLELSEVQEARFVVVLGGGLYRDKEGPITSELTDSSSIRLMEGLRLQRQLPKATLVVSGASDGQHRATADALGELAGELGVPPDRLLLHDQARDTSEEARALAAIVEEGDQIILVTEASHMTRSMKIFARQGLHPVPAPTLHRASPRPLHPSNLWPSARNVRKVERAIYEYVALVWIGLGGS